MKIYRNKKAGEKIIERPYTFFLDSKLRDPNSNEEIARIKEFDPSYNEEEVKLIKKSGCYVATAVYGSYDCPEVWTLRRFRDNTLRRTWPGRLFIRVYYAISPVVVKHFGKNTWFQNLWKPPLDRMVKHLNEKGVENTPYSD